MIAHIVLTVDATKVLVELLMSHMTIVLIVDIRPVIFYVRIQLFIISHTTNDLPYLRHFHISRISKSFIVKLKVCKSSLLDLGHLKGGVKILGLELHSRYSRGDD